MIATRQKNISLILVVLNTLAVGTISGGSCINGVTRIGCGGGVHYPSNVHLPPQKSENDGQMAFRTIRFT